MGISPPFSADVCGFLLYRCASSFPFSFLYGLSDHDYACCKKGAANEHLTAHSAEHILIIHVNDDLFLPLFQPEGAKAKVLDRMGNVYGFEGGILRKAQSADAGASQFDVAFLQAGASAKSGASNRFDVHGNGERRDC